MNCRTITLRCQTRGYPAFSVRGPACGRSVARQNNRGDHVGAEFTANGRAGFASDLGKRMKENDSPAEKASANSQVFSKGLKLLTYVARAGGEVGVREMARDMGMAVSVVHRLVSSLAEQEYLEKNPETGKYRVGYQAFEVGRTYLRSAKLEVCAPNVLRSVVQSYGVNAFLGVMRGSSVIYLIAMQDFGPYNIRVAPGSEVPLATTAMGKVLLADLRLEEAAAKLNEYAAQKFSAIEDARTDDVLHQLATIRRLGYAVSEDESFHGVISVGAPVTDFSGRVVAAISVGQPMRLQNELGKEKLIECAVSAAAEISRCLGAER